MDASPPPSITWTACGDGFECGTLTAPLAYADPSLGAIDLAVIRLPALSPSARIGALFVAPGGPGQSGVELLRALAPGFVPTMGEVRRRFDLVSFDVRGTGATGPVVACVDDATRAAIPSNVLAAASDAEVDALLDAALAGCTTGTSTESIRHLDTRSTAHDIDRLRQALGDDRISIMGSSYGAWIATVFAATHPDRLRAAVLGSALSGRNSVLDREEEAIRGSEAAVVAFAAWCDIPTAGCAFRPASGTTYAALQTLAQGLVTSPLTSGTRTLDVVTFGTALRGMLYEPRYPDIAAMLVATRDQDPAPAFAALDAFTSISATWKDSPALIHALDDLRPGDAATGLAMWRQRLVGLAADAPLFTLLSGGDRDARVRLLLRATWTADDPVTSVAAPTAPPLLVVSGPSDPVTWRTGAEELVTALGNGSAMLTTDAPGHAGIPSTCSTHRASLYLIDPSAPIAPTGCVERTPRDETPLGTVDAPFVWDGQSSRRAETGLGDFVTAAMLAAVPGADIAVVNGGGLRAGLPASAVLPADTGLRRPQAGYAAGPPYDLVVQDARAISPFSNRVAAVDVTGADLWALLEFAVSQWTSTTGSSPFLQVAGLRVAFSGSAAAGSRVQALTLADGTPIANDTSTTYTLVLPDFVYYGGSGYLGLIDKPAQVGMKIDDALIAAITADPTVTFATDGRIEIRP
ncbi:MAG: alpha/beta fold hydrolase [Deltaproteobacteria bacterium]|nr:alpha/beta fold hydrolase [Deltaproteobacteria bacterium]